MLVNEGMIEASAAERGVRGASVARQLVQNNANFGISQAMRSRGLREAGYDAREVYGDINRDLKGKLNQAFGRVAIQPIADLPPPKPVMQNVGMTLMLGMGQALGAGLEGMQSQNALKPITPPATPPTTNNAFSQSFNTSGLIGTGSFMNYSPNINYFATP